MLAAVNPQEQLNEALAEKVPKRFEKLPLQSGRFGDAPISSDKEVFPGATQARDMTRTERCN